MLRLRGQLYPSADGLACVALPAPIENCAIYSNQRGVLVCLFCNSASVMVGGKCLDYALADCRQIDTWSNCRVCEQPLMAFNFNSRKCEQAVGVDIPGCAQLESSMVANNTQVYDCIRCENPDMIFKKVGDEWAGACVNRASDPDVSTNGTVLPSLHSCQAVRVSGNEAKVVTCTACSPGSFPETTNPAVPNVFGCTTEATADSHQVENCHVSSGKHCRVCIEGYLINEVE